MKILSETFNFSKKNVWYYLILIGALIIILFEANTGNDFDIYISAASDLFHNKNIYLTTYNDGYHYYYSVLFALLLIPFTFIPIYIVKVIWLLLNIFFVYRLWQIITGLLPYSFSKKIKTLFTIVSFIFILRFLRDNFHLAQVTIFLLYLSMEGLHQIFKGRKLSGSALIALGINIKLMPILLIPYLFYRNEIKAGIYTIIIYIFFFFIPVLCIGWKNNIALLTEWWNLVNPVNTTNIVDAEERSFHSLSTLLSVYLLDDPGDKHALHVKRNIINVSYNTLFILLTISRIALLLLFLYFLRTLPFKKPRSSLHILYETGYIFLITPLIFPHQQHYAFFFLFPSVIYLIYTLFLTFLIADKKIILRLFEFAKKRQTQTLSITKTKQLCSISTLLNNHCKPVKFQYKLKRILFLIVMLIIYFLTNCSFVLGEYIAIYEHFKLLTFGALTILLILMAITPEWVNKVQSK